MSLPITFHRAASAEFIEASAWYESKQFGLALEFMAEIDRCVSLASEHPLQFAIVREDIRRVSSRAIFGHSHGLLKEYSHSSLFV